MNPLEVRNIYKSFSQGDHYLMVLKGAGYTLEPGMVSALIGPSGSGKSTFLEIIGLLDKPDSGDVLIRGVNISKANDERLTRIRGRHIGFVYQFHHLLPEFTALENVMLQDLINGMSKKQALKRAMHILELLKLDTRLNHLPSELSGGEQQRVAIARALVKSPSIILADEPTGNLDPYNAELVLEIFISAVKELKLAALVVTHNEQLARRMDAIVTLKDGKITSL
ncbi:MAG: ABC transporter ATP-binding protein [Rickettsiales bacterium]|jgi:lipoprotein-releasing system ATP-binding protein|nr:ABC transporter ATP-binding protein [Rickettsiales bacterium]